MRAAWKRLEVRLDAKRRGSRGVEDGRGVAKGGDAPEQGI